MQRNQHNCNNLQTLSYINVAGTESQSQGSGWRAWFRQSKT